MRLINYLLILCFLFQSYYILSQDIKNIQVDSLKELINNGVEDTSTVNRLNALSAEFANDDPTEAIIYGEKAKALAKKLNYQRGLGYALKNIGMGHYHLGDYLKVFEYWPESLKTFESIHDTLGIANIVNNLGVIYFNQGDNAQAIDYYLRSLQISEVLKDTIRIATALLNIGSVYAESVNTYDNALHYYWMALPLGEEIGDNEIIGAITDNIGDIYLKRNQLDSAQYYLEKSLIANDNTIYLLYSLNLLGEVFEKKGDYKTAIQQQKEAYSIAESLESKHGMAQSLVGLGVSQRSNGELVAAVESFKQSESIGKEIGSKNILKDTYQGLALAHEKLGKYREAFRYHTLYSSMKDTIFNTETDDKIKRLQFTYEIDKKQYEIEDLTRDKILQDLEIKQQRYINYAAIIAGILLFLLAGGMFNRYRFIRRTKKIIELEKERSDKLLLNILPEETADELKENGTAKARSYNNVTILFTDFKGFTELSATLSPPALVKEIHHCYMAFDEIMVRHKVEKIKTIGDAYMAAGGLPMPNDSHPVDVTLAAIEIREFMDKLIKVRKKAGKPYFEIRIGIHSGPVVAGVVGTHKFAYDIWGDTVNIASRMESNSEPGKINISDTTYDLIKDQFECIPRGKITVKGAGEKTMFFVEKAMDTQLV